MPSSRSTGTLPQDPPTVTVPRRFLHRQQQRCHGKAGRHRRPLAAKATASRDLEQIRDHGNLDFGPDKRPRPAPNGIFQGFGGDDGGDELLPDQSCRGRLLQSVKQVRHGRLDVCSGQYIADPVGMGGANTTPCWTTKPRTRPYAAPSPLALSALRWQASVRRAPSGRWMRRPAPFSACPPPGSGTFVPTT